MAISFVAVGKDGPVYELDLAARREDAARGAQFILHAALDMVDVHLLSAKETYLKVVDRHGEQLVSAHVTVGGTRLLLLHEGRNEENIRTFFAEVNELLVKLLLNPFYRPHSRIDSRDFDARVRALARRHLAYRGE